MIRMSLVRAQEQREQRRREEEYKNDELRRYYGKVRETEAGFKSIENVHARRRIREMKERDSEYETLMCMEKDYVEKKLQDKWAAEEEAFVQAMGVERKAKMRAELDLKRIREESEELRELEDKLRAAEMNMERKLQLEEARMIKEREQQYHAYYDTVMESQRQKLVVEEEKKERVNLEKQIAAKKVLQEQIEEKLDLQRAAQEEFEKERRQVDEVIARIQEEDRLQLEAKHAKQRETQDYIRNFLDERERERALKREKEEEEERRIAAYAAEVQRRSEANLKRRQDKMNAQDRILDKLRSLKEKEMAEKEEEERLLNLLHEQEESEKQRMREQAEADRRERMKREMMEANEYQKALKEQKRQQEEVEEEAFRKKMLEKFAEDDRIEQMNAQRRRMKVQEHKRDVERLIDEKREMYNALKKKEIEEAQAYREQDARRAAIVEMERKRLLKEYATKYKDFLPKGVIQNEEELREIFGV